MPPCRASSEHPDRSWIPALTGVYFGHFPDGTSNRNIAHWVRNAASGAYANNNGVSYDLSRYAVPTRVWFGTKDMLGDPSDVNTLINALGIHVLSHAQTDYAHMDFVWGKNAATAVYTPLIEYLKA